LTWWARQNGQYAEIIESADSINQNMPVYVAKRAMTLINSKSENPKILILGVAYKPGVGDVRETPVSELYKYLVAHGATVAWHDPFVPRWNDSTPVEIGWDCELAILTNNQPGMDLNQLIARGRKILDCTNSLKKSENVIPI
jgi:UDP-N-acetyl-D-glucosamine dehydrogenase